MIRSNVIISLPSPLTSTNINSSDACLDSSNRECTTTTDSHNLITSPTWPTDKRRNKDVGDEVNDDNPKLEETLLDKEINFELAEYFAKGQDLPDHSRYLGEKKRLIGYKVLVKNKINKKKPVEWKVCRDILDPSGEESEDEEESDIGVLDFPFNKFPVNTPDQKKPRINTLHLLLHMWPGSIKDQLDGMNKVIIEDNVERRRRGRPVVKPVSLRELGVFLAILLIACLEGKKGSSLWVGSPDDGEGYKSQIDVSEFMKEYRNRQIRDYFELFFADHLKKGTDAWWRVLAGIEGFNKRRKVCVSASRDKTHDESMSAFQPRTTPTGEYWRLYFYLFPIFHQFAHSNVDPYPCPYTCYPTIFPFDNDVDADEPGGLPNISFISRKPQPLGTEFKVVCDSKTGIMLYVELQRGKKGMENAKYNNEMIKTAACTARLIEETKREKKDQHSDADLSDSDNEVLTKTTKKETYYADAWFGSVDSVVAAMDQGCHLICVIKTCHNRYPKKWIEEKMDKWPPGSHLLLESKIEGKKMYAIGYKYCKRKVLCFLFSEGAGHTEPGKPYVARWKDQNGNTARRFIRRPQVISKYFERSNAVDMHNHARQGELQLEKGWVTTNGFFRVATTLFAMTITDCWKAYRFHLHPRHRHKKISLVDYSSLVAKDLLTNKMTRMIPSEDTNLCLKSSSRAASSDQKEGIEIEVRNNSEVPSEEKLTQDSFLADIDLWEGDKGRFSLKNPDESKRGDDIDGRLYELHTIAKNESWTSEDVVRTGKDGSIKKHSSRRRKRGKCLYCNRNTGYYCPTCPATDRSCKHWVCGPPVALSSKSEGRHAVCQRAHQAAWKKAIENDEENVSVD